MKESLYLGNNIAIVNLSSGYCQNANELASSDGFAMFLERYLKDLAIRDIKIYSWLTGKRQLNEMITEMVKLTKQLLVLDIDDIYSPIVDDAYKMRALYIVEDAYYYWHSKQRFSYMNVSNNSVTFDNFVDIDTKQNEAVLQLYRICSQKLQSKQNNVYRQLQAGTNAGCMIKNYKWNTPNGYNSLKNIGFINTVLLRTPILFKTGSVKREGIFTEAEKNPIKEFKSESQNWFCYPCKISGLLCFVYFHKDFMANGLSLGNLFELATEEECNGNKPDLIILFGNQDERDCCQFYHDDKNDIWVGSVSYDRRIEYFGYLKEMILTLHNLARLDDNALPIHGSMLRILFKDGTIKTLVLVGDSNTGKFDTIQTLKRLSASDNSDKKIEEIETIFDDMGFLYLDDNIVYGKGTEIGAFMRLSDFDKRTSYKDKERSIIFNQNQSSSRVLLPISSYDLVNLPHKIDIILYANNYQQKCGVERFSSYRKAKEVLVEGKRIDKDDCDISATFMANPFGPMQKPEQSLKVMDNIFETMYRNDVYVGQIYTNHATDHKEKLDSSVEELLEILKEL